MSSTVSQDTLLGETTKRVKLDDGSHLNVMDDSDLIDFIHHHAGVRRGRGCFHTRRSSVHVGKPHRPDAKETPSDTIAVGPENLNQACSFPVETKQHEFDPDGNRAEEMVTHEMRLDDENGGDSETIVQKPLTSSQKKVIQNIHNMCGHPGKEEFLRALGLSRARRESECPACAAKGHPPKPRLPAALPRTFRFNETLGVDLF